jgi:hypothetical protein
MQQNCQLAGDGDDRSFLSAFASMFGELQSPPPQVGVLSEGPQDVLCPLNQHHPQIGISLPGDMQLRLALSGVPSARLQSYVAARITALSKSPRVFQRQYVGQGDQCPNPLDLLGQRHLRIALLGQCFDLSVVLADPRSDGFQCA